MIASAGSGCSASGLAGAALSDGAVLSALAGAVVGAADVAGAVVGAELPQAARPSTAASPRASILRELTVWSPLSKRVVDRLFNAGLLEGRDCRPIGDCPPTWHARHSPPPGLVGGDRRPAGFAGHRRFVDRTGRGPG